MMHDDDLDPELLAALTNAAHREAPSAALQDRLMRSIDGASRFERFAARVGALCDLAHDAAQKLLDSIDDATKWSGSPEMSLFDIQGGPRVAGAVVGFVRMPAGAAFPHHMHLGEEIVLVLQGGLIDEDGTSYRAGEESVRAPGTAHSFTAAPGPDLLYLVVAEKGLQIGDSTFGPGDPGM
jgi:putative transcriptional regulator